MHPNPSPTEEHHLNPPTEDYGLDYALQKCKARSI